MSSRGLQVDSTRRAAAGWRSIVEDACWFLATCSSEVATSVTVVIPLDPDPSARVDASRQVRALVAEFGLTARVELDGTTLAVHCGR